MYGFSKISTSIFLTGGFPITPSVSILSYGFPTIIDADAQAFITAAGITDTTQKNAVNTLVLDLKAGTLWTKGDVILPIIGGSASQHRGDLKTATDKVTWSGGITHNSDGVLFNGTTGYGSVSWQAPNTYDRTAAEWNKYAPFFNSAWSGMFNGTNVFGMQLFYASALLLRTSAVGLNNLLATSLDNNFGLRTSTIVGSGTNQGAHYANGTPLQQATPNATPTGLNYFIGALNSSGSPTLYNNRLQQFFYFGDGLTTSEISELTTIISTFNTTLGR